MSKRATIEELRVLLEDAEVLVPKGSVWRHYRDNSGDKPYTIHGQAVAEQSEEIVILYQNNEGILFSRPLKEFLEVVRGGTQKRFQKIS